MKGKSLADILSYMYIKRIKRWMDCPVCYGRLLFSKQMKAWVCARCEYTIHEDDFLDDFVFWFCDGCGTYLNVQPGFDRKGTHWVCEKCGFDNDTTFNNIHGECKDCGALLMNPDATICRDCKIVRLQKAKAVLSAASDMCFALSDAIRPKESASTAYQYIGDSGDDYDEEEDDDDDDDEYDDDEDAMKCGYCGNTDTNSLCDEGDTIYCSLCQHRTSVATGKDDVVLCPYCHRMRDRKAVYCRHCNDSTWQASTPAEFAEIDRILKELGH